MKQILFLLILLPLRLFAPNTPGEYIPLPEPCSGFEPLIKAVMQVESEGKRLAFNFDELARGPLQIRPIRLQDFNRRTGKNYQEWDCYKWNVSREIFLHYCKDKDYERIAKSWNGSGPMTIEYWSKVKRYL